MRVLITGGSGFIGKSLLGFLAAASNEYQVLALTKSGTNPVSADNIEWFSCDLFNVLSWQAKVFSFKPEVVIHLAWEGIPDFSYEKCFLNLKRSISFGNTILSIGSVKKLIVTGSCFEYNKLTGICSETDVCKAKDYFTWAKNTLREYLTFESSKQNVLFGWARLFYVYGPFQRSGSLIPTIISNIKELKVPDIRTPANANDFIYVDDVSRGIVCMLNTEFESGIYNFGSGEATLIFDICKMVEYSLLGTNNLTKELEPRVLANPQTVNFVADMKKSSTILGWKPLVSMEEGISNISKL